MKLKYKIAKASNLDAETLIKRILLSIQRGKYGIIEVTGHSVSFDDHTAGLVGNWEYAKRMKSGKFEIVANGTSNIVLFEYYPIPVFEFIWVAILCLLPTIVGFLNNFYFAGVISIVFLGQLLFKHYNLKGVADSMLNEVAN